MRKTYEVELVTSSKNTDPECIDFWMYRGYSTKEEALVAGEVLSKFFPCYKYATEIRVKECDLIGKTLGNEKIIKRYKLKDEKGKVVKGE
jgi:hypothetical protein